MATSEHERVGAAFGRLMQALGPLLFETWLETELTMAQLKLLSLVHTRGRASGREIAHALGVGPSAVSQLVDRLVADGYIHREEDREDRRITWLALTARGRTATERLVLAHRERFGDVVATLSAPQLTQAQVAEALDLLAEAAERLRPGSTAAATH